MMKLSIQFLLTVLLSSVAYTACAKPLKSYLDPVKGYSLLKSVPDKDLYRTFCQIEIEKVKGISPERIQGCHDALDEIGARLLKIADGSEEKLIDLPFLKLINGLLLQDNSSYHSSVEDSRRFGFCHKSDDVIRENINIAKDIHSLTGTDLQIAFGCRNIKHSEDMIKKFQKEPDLHNDPFKASFHQNALACLELHNDQKTLEQIPSEKKAFYSYEVKEMMQHRPIPIRLQTTDNLRKFNLHLIFSLPYEAQRPYLNNLLENIDTKLKNDTWPDMNSRNVEIVKVSRTLLLIHAFDNGNTRTSLLMLNMLRLGVGLKPFQSNLLPSLRQWSSSEMVKQYYLNLINPTRVEWDSRNRASTNRR